MIAATDPTDDPTHPRWRPEDWPPKDGPEAEVWRMHVEELIEAAVRRIQPPWVADETLAPVIAERERLGSPPGAGVPVAAPGRPRRSGGPIGRPRVGLGSGPSAELRVRVGQDVLNALATSASIRGMTVATLVRQLIDEELGGDEDPEELLEPEEAAAWRLHPAAPDASSGAAGGHWRPGRLRSGPTGRTLRSGAGASSTPARCPECGMTPNDDRRDPADRDRVPMQRGVPLTEVLLDAIADEAEVGFSEQQLRGTARRSTPEA